MTKKKSNKCKRRRVKNKRDILQNNKCYKKNALKDNKWMLNDPIYNNLLLNSISQYGGVKSDDIREPEYIDQPIIKKINDKKWNDSIQTLIEDYYSKHRHILDLEDNDVLTIIGNRIEELRREYNMLKEQEKQLRQELCNDCDSGIIAGEVIDGYPVSFDICPYCQ